jgi:hypothetical protein
MTIAGDVNKITYAANGSTTVWGFSFPVTAPTDIFVYVTNPAGTITQVPVGQYTVAVNPPIDPNPTSIGGSVTYPVSGAPLAVGNSITIVRLLFGAQPTSISNQSIVYPPVIEQVFDRLAMMDLQISETVNRAVKVPITDAPMLPLPPLAFRKNQAAVFDQDGNLVGGSSLIIGTTVSPVMIPVVTAPTLVQARAEMGVPGLDSPAFTGNPTAPTPPFTDNDTTIATTAFVQGVGSTLGVLIPSGTTMLFQQTNAPVGWTKVVAHNDKVLRVVNGIVGSGGAVPFSNVLSRITTDPHTLTGDELASHGHGLIDPAHAHGESGYNLLNFDDDQVGVDAPGSVNQMYASQGVNRYVGASTNSSGAGLTIIPAGGNQPHTHNIDLRMLYVDVILATKN